MTLLYLKNGFQNLDQIIGASQVSKFQFMLNKNVWLALGLAQTLANKFMVYHNCPLPVARKKT